MLSYWQGIIINKLSNGIICALFRCMNLATTDVVLWTAQTTILGFTSLMPLRAKYKQILNKDAKD